MIPSPVPNADVVTLIFEVQRLAAGGQPHAPDSREAQAIDRSVHRCVQAPGTAALAALARQAITAARAGIKVQA